MFSYPLQVHPCRASVDAVLKWRPNNSSSSRESRGRSSPTSDRSVNPLAKISSASRADFMGETRFAAITTTILVLSYVAAMTVSSLEMVLAYVGSTGSTSISFILPGLFYYRISDPDSLLHQRLLKEDDDDDADQHQPAANNDADGLLGGVGFTSSKPSRQLLRRLSLALAIYGLVVMIVCLITNTFFILAH